MKVLVFGAQGMLGKDLILLLSPNHEVTGKDIADLNILEAQKVRWAVEDYRPQIVINAAAYTDVDGCENHPEKAFAVNAEGARNIALGCKAFGAKMIHLSTDYVFDGVSSVPYRETDSPNPLNVYGASKLLGERYIQEILNDHLIIRTEWLYGQHGRNFVDNILKQARQKSELRVVNDQRGAPTLAKKLSWAIGLLLTKDATGILHVTSSGSCTWFEFAVRIMKIKKIDHIRLIPISSQELNRSAKRPANSLLDCSPFEKITGFKMVSWEEALQEYLSPSPPEGN
jgi:dTDP-4-dehydrorhamnose reductase